MEFIPRIQDLFNIWGGKYSTILSKEKPRSCRMQRKHLTKSNIHPWSKTLSKLNVTENLTPWRASTKNLTIHIVNGDRLLSEMQNEVRMTLLFNSILEVLLHAIRQETQKVCKPERNCPYSWQHDCLGRKLKKKENRTKSMLLFHHAVLKRSVNHVPKTSNQCNPYHFSPTFIPIRCNTFLFFFF